MFNTDNQARAAVYEALVSGTADPAPRDRPWPLALRWTRVIGIGRLRYNTVTTVVDFLIAWYILGLSVAQFSGRAEGGLISPPVAGIALALPVAFRSISPLVAWRAEAVSLTVVTLASGDLYVPVYPLAGGAGYLFCLYSVAVRCSRRITVSVGLISVTGAAVLQWRSRQPTGGTVLVAATLIIAVLLLGYNVRQRRLAQQEVVTQARVHAEAQSVLQERQRIARELHDVVAHHMSVIAIQAEAGPYKVAEPQPELAETLADIRQLALEGLSELRRILGVLRTEEDGADTAPQPGLDRLGELISTAEAGGLTVECAVSGAESVVPRATALSAYRIVQEALSNVMRHAPGAHVRIVTEYGLDRLSLTVANSPVDTTPDTALNEVGSGQGLVGMRERAGMLGGELTAEPTPEGGFVVTATLPLEPAS